MGWVCESSVQRVQYFRVQEKATLKSELIRMHNAPYLLKFNLDILILYQRVKIIILFTLVSFFHHISLWYGNKQRPLK